MRQIGFIAFAFGIMIAVSGGAKVPFVALTLTQLSQGLESGTYQPSNMHDIRWDRQNGRLHFHNLPSDNNSPSPPILHLVRFGTASPEVQQQVQTQLEQLGIAFQQSPTPDVSAFPTTWGLFSVGIAVSLVGLFLWRQSRLTTSTSVLGSGPQPSQPETETPQALEQLTTALEQLALTAPNLSTQNLVTQLEDFFATHVHPLTEQRQFFTDHFGMRDGAELLVTLACGERLTNRAWSAAADAHPPEAQASLREALEAYQEAQRLQRKFSSERALTA